MIEKNSEIMPVLVIDTDKPYAEKDLFNYISKKKNGNRNDSGEDIYVQMLNLFPDLYQKKTLSEGKLQPNELKINKPVNHNRSTTVMLGNEKKQKNIKVAENKQNSTIGLSEITTTKLNKITELNEERVTSNRHAIALIGPKEPVGKSIKFVDDEGKEKLNDAVKNHTIASQLKSDNMPLRHDIQSPDMKARPFQPSVSKHQPNNNEVIIEKSGQKNALHLDYPFQRWSGEHSVKVSLSIGNIHNGNLTLLPSDSRAAEVLSKQINQLDGYSAELLLPNQDEEDSQQQQQQQQQQRQQQRQYWEEELE